MTNVSVISTFTAIHGSGKVEFESDIAETTVRDVKEQVQQLANVPIEKQSIWWRGYILDDESLSLSQACVGVNEGEHIEVSPESLVLFMTIPVEEKYQRRPTSPLEIYSKATIALIRIHARRC